MAQEAEQILELKSRCLSCLWKTFSLHLLRSLDCASTLNHQPWTVEHCAPIKIWPWLWVLKTYKCSQRKSGLLDLTQNQLNQVLDWLLEFLLKDVRNWIVPLCWCTMQTRESQQHSQPEEGWRGSCGHSMVVAGPWPGGSIYFKSD